MSEESKELHDIRQAEYARALSQCPAPVEAEPDVDEDACEKCKGLGVIIRVKPGWDLPREITCPKCGGRGV